jgi:hypothetical protein
MPRYRAYVVKQGDYLTRLAFIFGFDAREVWKDPRNADLRALRESMDVLCPGDVLFLPEPTSEVLPLALQADNAYVCTPPMVEVCYAFRYADGQPIAGRAYAVWGLDEPVEGVTSPDGWVRFMAPISVDAVRIAIAGVDFVFALFIGWLDPANEPSGITQRLRSLGHLRSPPDSLDPDDPFWKTWIGEARGAAVTSFQRTAGLPETGLADQPTWRALRDAHGC